MLWYLFQVSEEICSCSFVRIYQLDWCMISILDKFFSKVDPVWRRVRLHLEWEHHCGFAKCPNLLWCAPVDLHGSPQRPTRRNKRDDTLDCYSIENLQLTLYHSQTSLSWALLSNVNELERCTRNELQLKRQTDNYCFLFPLQLLTMLLLPTACI